MIPNSLSITLNSSDEKILAILNPDAVFKCPKADGKEKLEEYIKKKKEEADEQQRTG